MVSIITWASHSGWCLVLSRASSRQALATSWGLSTSFPYLPARHYSSSCMLGTMSIFAVILAYCYCQSNTHSRQQLTSYSALSTQHWACSSCPSTAWLLQMRWEVSQRPSCTMLVRISVTLASTYRSVFSSQHFSSRAGRQSAVGESWASRCPRIRLPQMPRIDTFSLLLVGKSSMAWSSLSSTCSYTHACTIGPSQLVMFSRAMRQRMRMSLCCWSPLMCRLYSSNTRARARRVSSRKGMLVSQQIRAMHQISSMRLLLWSVAREETREGVAE